jgi:Raf kinase inhibitor-like YbhB/YbcL family protein
LGDKEHREVAGRRLQVAGAAVVALLLAGCGSSGPSISVPSSGGSGMRLTSSDLGSSGRVPVRFTCDGAGARPAMSWSDVPARAAALALLVGDPDAPGGTFIHWTVWNLPPSVHGVGGTSLPPGAVQGANSAGKLGWIPPCPPKGARPHRYVFGLYALRSKLNLAQGADAAQAVNAVKAASLESTALVARYGR